jgi:hypothetical protein
MIAYDITYNLEKHLHPQYTTYINVILQLTREYLS